jgi:predicted Rossmann-fold nucleotide-binding protein
MENSQQFALASDAFIIVHGGIGTTLEAAMVWQLIQVGHINKDTPLIFVGEMWEEFLVWARKNLLEKKLVNPEDLEIPYCVKTAEEAVAIIQKYHKKWAAEK